MRHLAYLCAAILIVPQLLLVVAFQTLDLANVMALLDLLLGREGLLRSLRLSC